MKSFSRNRNIANFPITSKKLGQKLDRVIKGVFLTLVYFYKAVGSIFMGGACRFQPSCSEYALDVLKSQTAKNSFKLITKRLLSCRPGGKFGYDPAPANNIRNQR